MSPKAEDPLGPMRLEHCDIEITCRFEPSHHGVAVRYRAHLMASLEDHDVGEEELGMVTLWRVRIDDSWEEALDVLDEIGGDVFAPFIRLWSVHGANLDDLFGRAGDVIYLERVAVRDKAATLASEFVEIVLDVIGRECAGAIADAPAGAEDFEQLAMYGFSPLLDTTWVRGF